MKRIKIRFQNREDSAIMIEVAKRGQVVGFRGLVFVVPEPAIELLDSLGAKYENLGVMHWDELVRALRNPDSAAVQ